MVTRDSSKIVGDVAIVGGGLGGVSAALRIAERGLRPVLIEAGDELGGTALYSGGKVHIWNAATWAEFRALCPTSDEDLARALLDGFEPYARWLVSTGAPGDYRAEHFRGKTLRRYQLGKSMLPHHRQEWFRFAGAAIQRAGGTVMLGSRARSLLTDAGLISGVIADSPAGPIDIRADAVVLAAGGFQNNPALIEEHLAAPPGRVVRRSVAHNDGSGLAMAISVGARLTTSMDTVYGHMMPAPPAEVLWDSLLDPILLTAYFESSGILVDQAGVRFMDEGSGEHTGLTANVAVAQPAGDLWVVLDAATRRSTARVELPWREIANVSNARNGRLLRHLRFAVRRGRPTVLLDAIGLQRERGAVVVTGHTIAELTGRLADHGVDGHVLASTIDEYNVAVADGRERELAIPRTKPRLVNTPPFVAVKVAVGVSMTYGGVAINPRAEALDADDQPIPGLFAVPGTAGGVHHRYYGGSLAACGVFGYLAAERIAELAGAAR